MNICCFSFTCIHSPFFWWLSLILLWGIAPPDWIKSGQSKHPTLPWSKNEQETQVLPITCCVPWRWMLSQLMWRLKIEHICWSEQLVRHKQGKGASPSPRRTPSWPAGKPSLVPSYTVKDTLPLRTYSQAVKDTWIVKSDKNTGASLITVYAKGPKTLSENNPHLIKITSKSN